MNASRLSAAVLAPIVAIALSACGSDTDTGDDVAGGSTDATVTVETFQFRPDPIVVDAGTAITFVNNDAIDHTVTAGTRDNPTPQAFDGQLPQKGATFELTLDEPGTYDYFCEIHPGPGMTGTITVE